MRSVWSFWSLPFKAFKGRMWRQPKHHLMSWGLSLRLAQEYFPETVLITDTWGKELLVDDLGLEFAHVSTELDRLKNIDPEWWALGKLVAYRMQEKPFIHLDTDVFLWKPLPPSLLSADVFTQCPEHHSLDEAVGPYLIEDLFAKFELPLPVEWVWSRSTHTTWFPEENCGIFGGNNIPFIRYFSQAALDLVTSGKHADAWSTFGDKDGSNMLVEQYLLSACIGYHRSNPQSPFRGISSRHLFPSFAESYNPSLATKAGFTHLLGDAKTNEHATDRLERRIAALDPSFLRHCTQVLNTLSEKSRFEPGT
ncbi:DUF6734 family protein [Edaphobacter aggregans]|uniref:DUF6734 family protein n=1 Tax=Edaphobacter aggregans TaxID=570835 RepID=UPI000554B2D1